MNRFISIVGRVGRGFLALVIMLGGAFVAPTYAAGPPDLAEAFRDLRADPVPESLTLDRHFLVSNEANPQHFYPAVQGRGGVVIAIGAEQPLLYGAWARADAIIAVDFDPWIVALHRLTRAVLTAAYTPEIYRSYWTPEGRPRLEQLARTLADPSVGARPFDLTIALAVIAEATERFPRRHALLIKAFDATQIPSYLDDAASYAHLRKLAVSGRYIALRADATRPRGFTTIAAALRRANAQVGVLYLSNIEDYFTWRQPYRDNMSDLPFAPDAQVLRTHAWRPDRTKRRRYFTYATQESALFKRWLAAPRVRGVRVLLGKRAKLREGHIHLTAEPPR